MLDSIQVSFFLKGSKCTKDMTPIMYVYHRQRRRAGFFPVFSLNVDDKVRRTLLAKVNADFLTHVKASIGIELTRQPITLTY
jgi:hypothetical protein